MKAKKRKSFLIIIILVLVALVAAAVYFFQFNQYGYIMTVPYRSAFTEIADHVYINKGNTQNHQEILELIEQAEERDRSFWGDLRYLDETILIICDDEKLMATTAIDKGMPIEQVQRLLGHEKIDTTLHYAMVKQSNIKSAHRKYIG